VDSKPTADPGTGWPAHVRPGALRFARASDHYQDTVAFYRDLVGLPVVDSFSGSFDEDGTIFGLPDTAVQLEIVRAHGDDRAAGSFDPLALYLDDLTAVERATQRLRAAGLTPAPAHPYWAANGAVVYRDPDGRDVVYAPWVDGRDPEPIDIAEHDRPTAQLHIDWYDGDRQALRPLFEQAEDSRVQLDGYIDSGRVLVARRGDDLVGHLQLTGTGRDGELEIKNMAVRPDSRGAGIGRRLVHEALRIAAAAGVTRMLVATAAADVGNLRFYQRCGFRFLAVERDAFTPATGYPEPVVIDGIALLDRMWLAQDL